jgi:CRISPR-associated protein (TIGR03984 family)
VSESLFIYTAICREVGAKDALLKVAGTSEKEPFLLVYSSDCCCFATFDSVKNFTFLTEKEGLRELDIFEFRYFCEKYELRWVRESGKNTGKAVLIAEQDYEINGFERKEPFLCAFSRSDQYLLWGTKNERQEAKSGETFLFDHRVGLMRIPQEAQGDRSSLHFREYFSKDDYGNLVLKAERCLTLKPTLA